MENIGNRIKFHRERCDLTQDELAQRINVKPQTIYKYEQGLITNIPISKIMQMADIFGIPAAQLVGWDYHLIIDKPLNPAYTPLQQQAVDLIMQMDESQLRRFVAAAKAFLD